VIQVRPATSADVPAMSAVLTASITELCTGDHRNNPEIVARWTRNKSPESVATMLANPDLHMFVAETDGEVAAVGSITTSGEVSLNYVSPNHRLAGVSRALLAAMEDAIRSMGFAEAKLDSTTTAHRFYLGAGWTDTGPAVDHNGLTCHPMRKALE
jgi:GNAT superfamily N-acetyltransferase